MPTIRHSSIAYSAGRLDQELPQLAIKYAPPYGRTLLVELDGRIVAGGAYRRIDEDHCELKRLFVGDAARGYGLGRQLTAALINAAERDGYSVMRLDTGDRMQEAIALYESLGFRRIAPYLAYPDAIAERIIFMEKTIASPQ